MHRSPLCPLLGCLLAASPATAFLGQAEAPLPGPLDPPAVPVASAGRIAAPPEDVLGSPLDLDLTRLEAEFAQPSKDEWQRRLDASEGDAALVPVGDFDPHRELVLLVPGHGRTFRDLHALVRLRDRYQLLVGVSDQTKPGLENAEKLAGALERFGGWLREATGGPRPLRVVGHSLGGVIAPLLMDQLAQRGLLGDGPGAAFDRTLLLSMDAPLRGVDIPLPLTLPGINRIGTWITERLPGGKAQDLGAQSTFNRSPTMRALRALEPHPSVTTEMVTVREGKDPEARFGHYEPIRNWYSEELAKGELVPMLQFLVAEGDDTDDLRTWTGAPVFNRREGLRGLFLALRLDQDAAAGLPAMRAALRATLAQVQANNGGTEAALQAMVPVYDAWIAHMVATFEGGHTEFMWDDPRFMPWLRQRLAEGPPAAPGPPGVRLGAAGPRSR